VVLKIDDNFEILRPGLSKEEVNSSCLIPEHLFRLLRRSDFMFVIVN
jgi:hypothetical protein